jgi:hypothetical protein
MIEARPAPTSETSTIRITNAVAVQSTPSTTSEMTASVGGTEPGIVSTPAGVRSTLATARLAAMVARGS